MAITLPLKTNAPPPLWEEIISKPYITVSSKGLANGLSDKINDGADFGPDTPGTQTSGIMEAINYVLSLTTNNTTYYPEIHLLPGEFLIHQPIYLNYTQPPSYISSTSGNASAITAPSLIGSSGRNGQANFIPLNTYIKCASDFPVGEYAIAFLLPPTAYISGATNPQWVGGILKNFTLDCNNRGAGICLIQYGNAEVKNIAIRNPTVPNPTITLAPSTNSQYQTGAFVYTTTTNSGEDTTIEDIQIRGSSYEDGFVLYLSGGQNDVFRRLWCASGAQRYGFLVYGYIMYPLLFESCTSDTSGGWTGAVPNISPTPPQSASFFLYSGPVTLLNFQTFVGAPTNSPFIVSYGYLTIINSYLRGSPSPVTNNPYVIFNPGNRMTIINSTIQYNSSYYGVLNIINAANDGTPIQFINVNYVDDNSGTPSVPPFKINWGALGVPWTNYLWVQPFYDSQGRFMGGYPPSLQANPPASGTLYQNQNPYDIQIYLPVYASTYGTSGTVTIATGSSTSTLQTIVTKFVNGSTSITATELTELVVPAGRYYEYTFNGVTASTATVLVI